MKRTLASLFLVAWCGVLLGNSPSPRPAPVKPAPLLEELVQMTKAGSSDAAVLAYAQAHRLELPPQVSDDALRWLRDSGVSERVVAYMSAFDVRAADEGAQEDVASGSQENAVRPRAVYSYPEGEDEGYGSPSDRYPGNYADNSYDAYSSDYGYYPDCGYGFYPDCSYGYYPYPLFFADQRAFLGRFDRRGHRFRGHRGFDGGRGFRGGRGGAVGRGASRDAWRERDFRGGRRGPIALGPRGSARPAFAHGGFGAGPRRSYGRAISPRRFGSPGPARGSFPSGFRGPRGSVGSHGGVGHPGGFGHQGFSGGGPRVGGGSPGGRGRR